MIEKMGILLLIDTVDHIPQAAEDRTQQSPLFNKHIEDAIKARAKAHNASFIKHMEDGILLFFEARSDGTFRENFIECVTGLRTDSLEGKQDKSKSICKLRMVSHFTIFLFEGSSSRIKNFIEPESIRAFRTAKFAQQHEVFISDSVLNILGDILPEKALRSKKVFDGILKGFPGKIRIYKLLFPEEKTKKGKDILKIKMEELQRKCSVIPIFVNDHQMRMEDNFINLDISLDRETSISSQAGAAEVIHLKKTGKGMDSISTRDRFKDLYGLMERDKQESTTGFSNLTVMKLYEKFPRAMIFGLPGSGKTTTLSYFAFREFLFNRNAGHSEDERVVVFVSCFGIDRYNEWFEKHVNLYGKKSTIHKESVESYLYYFLHEFLFFQSAPKLKKEIQNAGRRILSAFSNGKLTLLVDALDEARSSDTKEDLLNAFRKLFQECKTGKKAGNRLYLTARFSERDQALSKKWEEIQEPVFRVRSLDMEQLRQMAEYFYKNDEILYNDFSEAVWKDEIAAKVGGTPLTALLVLIYFKCFHTLDSRFEMYNVLMTFLLARAWKHIKEGTFSWDLNTFFKKVKMENIFAEEPYKDAGVIYDALSLLAYTFEEGQIGDVKEQEILEIFKKFAAGVLDVVGEGMGQVEEEAKKWLSQLKEDHVLLPAGPSRYVFIHQTVMEYLAARFIKEKLKDHLFHKDKFQSDSVESVINIAREPFFQSEIIPIAVGGEIETGAKLLRLLHHRVSIEQDEKMKEVLYLTAIKCLAEWESYFDRQYRELRLPMFHSELKRKESENADAVEWIYTHIKNILESNDKQALMSFRDKYHRLIPRLTRSILIKQFLSMDTFLAGDSELISLRKRVLGMFIAGNEADNWLNQDAEAGLEIGNIDLCTFDSDEYHPDDRNFKYYRKYTGLTLQGLLGSPNFKHSHCVICVAISPDGKTVLSGSDDKTVKWWDLETGKEIQTFKGHTDYVKSIAFSPDGRTMASCSDDHTIKWWDLESGQEIHTFSGHDDAVNCIRFSPDGKTIISGSDDKTIRWWELSSQQGIKTLKGHDGPVNCISLSPDGKTIISGSDDKTIKLWELETGLEIKTFMVHTDHVTNVLFTPKGDTIISASWDKTIKWYLETGQEICTFKGHERPIANIALSPDGKTLISASWDKTLKAWDLESGKEIRPFIGHMDYVNTVVFSSDGKTMVSGSRDSTIRCWNLDSGKEIKTFRGHESFVNSISFSPDGQTLISGSRDNTLKWWDLQTGKEKQTFKGHRDHVNNVCFSPDGKTVISGSFDKTIKWWDLETARLIKTFRGHDYGISCVCFHPGGKTVVSGSFDNTVKLWNLESGKMIKTFRGHEGYVWNVAVSPDGKTMVSSSDDKTIKWWDLESGKMIKTFRGHDGHVYSIYFSPDGKTLVSGSSDQTLKLWNLESGEEIRTFMGHQGIVWSAVFSLDGKYIISCSWDNTIKIWELETGKCIKNIDMLWRPREIKPNPVKTDFYACANGNGVIALFDFSENMSQ